MQNTLSGRFQVYNPDFATATDLNSALVTPGLESIDRVPLYFMVSTSDETCENAVFLSLRDTVPSVRSYVEVLQGYELGHTAFGSVANEKFMGELIEQIELDVTAPVNFETTTTSTTETTPTSTDPTPTDDNVIILEGAASLKTGLAIIFAASVALY